MHLRCPCTAAMATADPPAPTEHIGSERAHARGLPAMLQLCSPSMSRPAQIKDQLDRERLDGSMPGLQCKVRNVDAHLAIQRPDTSGAARALQLVLRVGGSNGPDPVLIVADV